MPHHKNFKIWWNILLKYCHSTKTIMSGENILLKYWPITKTLRFDENKFSNKNFKILLKYCHSAKTLTSGDVTENIHSLFWAKKTGPRLSLFLWVEIWYQVKAFNQKKLQHYHFWNLCWRAVLPLSNTRRRTFPIKCIKTKSNDDDDDCDEGWNVKF